MGDAEITQVRADARELAQDIEALLLDPDPDEPDERVATYKARAAERAVAIYDAAKAARVQPDIKRATVKSPTDVDDLRAVGQALTALGWAL